MEAAEGTALAKVTSLLEERAYDQLGAAMDEAELEVCRSGVGSRPGPNQVDLRPSSPLSRCCRTAGAHRAVVRAVAARPAPVSPHLRRPTVSAAARSPLPPPCLDAACGRLCCSSLH